MFEPLYFTFYHHGTSNLMTSVRKAFCVHIGGYDVVLIKWWILVIYHIFQLPGIWQFELGCVFGLTRCDRMPFGPISQLLRLPCTMEQPTLDNTFCTHHNLLQLQTFIINQAVQYLTLIIWPGLVGYVFINLNKLFCNNCYDFI